MILLKIFKFEFGYQFRQVITWVYFVIIFAIAFLTISENYIDDARDGYFLINAPIVIAEVMVICCLFWLLIGASVAGEAATRDVQTRMFPLIYTSSVSKRVYLTGRLLAAFAINLSILLAIPMGILSALYLTTVEPELLTPFRFAAYLSPYFLLVIPNVLFVTAIQFSLSCLKRSTMVSYLGGAILFIAAAFMPSLLKDEFGSPLLGTLVDPIYLGSMMARLQEWSPIERNSRLIGIDDTFLLNRFLWLFIAMCALVFAYFRFRFSIASHQKANVIVFSRNQNQKKITKFNWGETVSIPTLEGRFRFHTQLYQLRRLTCDSFLSLAKTWSGLGFLALIALMAGFAMQGNLKEKGVPLLAQTDQILHILTGPLTSPGKFIVMIFLLTIFYAGELIWRERKHGLSEIANAIPVPEWVLFTSKYLALGLMVLLGLVFILLAGMISQFALGNAEIQLTRYVEVIFGFQLLECLLFALLVLAIHVIVNHKYLGHLIGLLILGSLIFAPILGVRHKLLLFSASPSWSYTDMGGYGSSVVAWLWFKGYWTGWALLIGTVAVLFWVRGKDVGIGSRLVLAVRRFTYSTLVTSVLLLVIIVSFGSFIFYNTNILNQYSSLAAVERQRAAYEATYGKYSGAAQPVLTKVDLRVEIYPDRGGFELIGNYMLVNKHSKSVDSIYLGVAERGETKLTRFSRPAKQVLNDEDLRFKIYALEKPLAPGDTLQLDFSVRYQVRGFTNEGTDSLITKNFSSLRNYEWLPVIGYQQYRELDEHGARKKYGLVDRTTTASLYNLKARNYAPFAEHVSYHSVIGTVAQHLIVAPGTLTKSWKRGQRRYFEFVTEQPIRNEYAIYSAKFAKHQEEGPVKIQIYYHPKQSANLPRMVKSIKASLQYYTKQFGPYPHRQLKYVAIPGYGGGNHAAPSVITAGEGFFLLNPEHDERGFDLVTAVVAHEVAHQWWGNQLKSAYMEGAGLLSESIAWYSAMGVLEEKFGSEYLQKLLDFMREVYENPRSKAAAPLLQATDFYHNYRKGPFALYAMSEYIGRQRVNSALASLLVKHPPGKLPMATSLNLYTELREKTPDSLLYLVDDLFKRNTFWELKTKQATFRKIKTGYWQVDMNVTARKVIVSEQGLEQEVHMNDWVEIGIYAPAARGERQGKRLYLQKHLINRNEQRLMVTLPFKPALAGIDPNFLLIDWDTADNLGEVKAFTNLNGRRKP